MRSTRKSPAHQKGSPDRLRAPATEAVEEIAIVAAPSAPLLASSQHAAMLRRGWSLLLLESAELSGLTPISADEMHSLAFLADCLAPVYGIPALDGILLRRESGPLFPDLQWDLDRLWAMGYLELSRLQHRQGNAVVVRSGYGATAEGSSRAVSLRESPLFDRLFTYFIALSTAVARLPASDRLRAMGKDLTYEGDSAPGTLVAYGDWTLGNLSVATADAFADAGLLPGMRIHPWERLSMYLALLRQRMSLRPST
jgi:hypothetical protein